MSAELIAAALLTGATWYLLAGNLIERRINAVARLAEPCIDHEKPLTSIGYICAAGAYLFVNEVLVAREEHSVSWPFTFGALVFAGLWCLAAGILSLEFLWQIAQLL